MDSIFLEISLVMVLALVLSIIAKALRQPILIAYLLTGVSIPILFGTANISQAALDTFSQIGIAFLLFIVGINLNLNVIKRLGFVSVAVGMLQMLATAVITFFVLQVMSVPLIPAIFLAVALSFSSTAVVVKLLSDKGDIGKLYGQLAVGILIVQDVVAVLALIIASSLSPATTFTIEQSVLIWGAIVVMLFLVTSYILPVITRIIAKSQELLFIFTICWCFTIAAIFYLAGIGIEIGALVAGLSLSTSTYHYEIAARIKPLRDFFLILYFFALGAQLSPQTFGMILPLVAALTIATVLAKIIFTYVGLRAVKYGKSVSFLSSICLSQVSEFSFVLVGVGVLLGQVPGIYLSVATSVGIITIAVSSYLISHGEPLFRFIFREKHTAPESVSDSAEMVLFGYNRVGYDLLKSLRSISKSYTVVDYNPDIVASLKKKGIPVIYGDASDVDFLSSIEFSKAKFIVSTIPEVATNVVLLDYIKSSSKKKPIFMAIAHKIDEATELYKAGADYVIMPHFLGARHVASLIEKYGADPAKFKEEKARHLRELQERRALGHEHPTLDFKI